MVGTGLGALCGLLAGSALALDFFDGSGDRLQTYLGGGGELAEAVTAEEALDEALL